MCAIFLALDTMYILYFLFCVQQEQIKSRCLCQLEKLLSTITELLYTLLAYVLEKYINIYTIWVV